MVTRAQASADLSVLGQQLAADFPDANRNLLPAALPIELVPSPFRGHMQLPLFPARAAGLLLGMFGLLALTLALVGLYGVVSYSVAQRTREIGVRMALGARRADVIRLIIRQGLTLTIKGMAIGLAGALAVTRVLSSVLYGIGATDPISFFAVAIVLTMVASVASHVPARRAMRVDPIEALRTE